MVNITGIIYGNAIHHLITAVMVGIWRRIESIQHNCLPVANLGAKHLHLSAECQLVMPASITNVKLCKFYFCFSFCFRKFPW